MFDFPSDEESSSDESPEPKSTPSMKIKLNKQASNESDAMATPPPKRRYVRKSNVPAEPVTNGSAKSESPGGSNGDGGVTSARKRGRPRLSKPSVITSNGDVPKKPITKPQAFMNEKEKVGYVKAKEFLYRFAFSPTRSLLSIKFLLVNIIDSIFALDSFHLLKNKKCSMQSINCVQRKRLKRLNKSRVDDSNIYCASIWIELMLMFQKNVSLWLLHYSFVFMLIFPFLDRVLFFLIRSSHSDCQKCSLVRSKSNFRRNENEHSRQFNWKSQTPIGHSVKIVSQWITSSIVYSLNQSGLFLFCYSSYDHSNVNFMYLCFRSNQSIQSSTLTDRWTWIKRRKNWIMLSV